MPENPIAEVERPDRGVLISFPRLRQTRTHFAPVFRTLPYEVPLTED
jgi:hypothetical protein